jgi:hypothetical protein
MEEFNNRNLVYGETRAFVLNDCLVRAATRD